MGATCLLSTQRTVHTVFEQDLKVSCMTASFVRAVLVWFPAKYRKRLGLFDTCPCDATALRVAQT